MCFGKWQREPACLYFKMCVNDSQAKTALCHGSKNSNSKINYYRTYPHC